MKTIRETSRVVANKLIELAKLTSFLKVLEPSAGEGAIVDAIMEKYPNIYPAIDCVEVNEAKCNILIEKGYNAYHEDFLNFKPFILYDRIIACPPFKNNVDLLHIMKMYDHLHWGGFLVSLTSPLWIVNNEHHQVFFRNWLADKKYAMQMLPDNSFMEKGKSVPTMIIKISKD